MDITFPPPCRSINGGRSQVTCVPNQIRLIDRVNVNALCGGVLASVRYGAAGKPAHKYVVMRLFPAECYCIGGR